MNLPIEDHAGLFRKAEYTGGASLQGFYGWPSVMPLAPYLRNKVWPWDWPRPPAEKFDGRHYMVTARLMYLSSGALTGGQPREHEVPAGYVTDGLSVPRLIWPTVGHPFDPRKLQCGLVHDVLCDLAANLRDKGARRAGWEVRRYADALFGEMLEWSGVGWFLRARMTLGVKAWGLLRYGAWPMRRGGAEDGKRKTENGSREDGRPEERTGGRTERDPWLR